MCIRDSRYPFLWGFHAVHHSAKSMDWLAGSRMHFVEIILLRSITSLPLFTLGFAPSVMQAYIGFVYVWSSLLHANVGGNFNRLGHWIATPRFHPVSYTQLEANPQAEGESDGKYMTRKVEAFKSILEVRADGIGPAVAEALADFFHEPHNRDLWNLSLIHI